MISTLSRNERVRRAALVQVISKTFVAGLLIYDDHVIEAAPILRKWTTRRTATEALAALRTMGFTLRVIRPHALTSLPE